MFIPMNVVPDRYLRRVFDKAYQNVTPMDALSLIKKDLNLKLTGAEPEYEFATIQAHDEGKPNDMMDCYQQPHYDGFFGIYKNFKSVIMLIDISAAAIRAEIEILSKIRTLAETSATPETPQAIRQNIAVNIAGLQKQLNGVMANAKLFGKSLITANSDGITIQTGYRQSDMMYLTPIDCDPISLGVDQKQLLTAYQQDAQKAVNAISYAIVQLQNNLIQLNGYVRYVEDTFNAALQNVRIKDPSFSSLRLIPIAEQITDLTDSKDKTNKQVLRHIQSVQQQLPAYIKKLLE